MLGWIWACCCYWQLDLDNAHSSAGQAGGGDEGRMGHLAYIIIMGFFGLGGQGAPDPTKPRVRDIQNNFRATSNVLTHGQGRQH